MIDPFAPLTEIHDRVDRVLRGEDLDTAPVVAGEVPAYYGCSTASEVCTKWLSMWERMREARPTDEAWHQANAIGWASRP